MNPIPLTGLIAQPLWTQTNWPIERAYSIYPSTVYLLTDVALQPTVHFSTIANLDLDFIAPPLATITDISSTDVADRQPPPPYLLETNKQVYRDGVTAMTTPDPSEEMVHA